MIPVWQGFDFGWDRAPHRLNELTSVAEDDAVRHAFTVGRVPDSGLARSWVTRLHAEGVHATHGTSEVQVTASLGERAAAMGRRIALPVVGHAAAILRGFEIRCDSCAVGLHTRGFGLDLDDVRIEDGRLSFSPTAWVHAANSPDPLTSGRGDYAYTVRLQWTVLHGAEDTVAFSEGAPVVHTHRGQAAPLEAHLPDVSTEHAVLGVRGLAVSQNYSGRWGRDGRFVRRVQAGVDDLARSPGLASFRPHLHFTNRGLITYPMDVEQRLHTTLIGYAAGTQRRQRVETRIRTGIGDGGRGVERLS